MTDDLVKRPVLRIYTEATSGNGGLWAFSPYKSVHTVFVEESNYRDLEDRIEALTAERDQLYERWNDCQEKRMAAVARAEAAEAERDAMAAENNRLRDALQTIIESYEATCELHTSHADCAANLYDHARAQLKGEQK